MAKLSNILTARSSQGPSDNFKNLIINGDMQVAQRSSSVASITTSNYYTADRWYAEFTSLGTWTQSVENDAPTGSGFRKSLKMLVTTADASPAAGDYALVQQRLEGQNLQQIAKGTSSAKQLTVSFWVKANVTGTYNVALYDNDNSGRAESRTYSVNASATWEKKTLTFDADTTGAFDNDNARSLDLSFWLGAGTNLTSGTANPTSWNTTTANLAPGQTNLAASTNNYWQITGVQLEVGSTATEFEFLPVQTELALCQRYYYLIANGNNAPIGNASYYSVGDMRGLTHFPVTMRTNVNGGSVSGTDYYRFERNSASDLFNAFEFAYHQPTMVLAYNTAQASGTVGWSGSFYTNHASAKVWVECEL
jgi:hypothetical protein